MGPFFHCHHHLGKFKKVLGIGKYSMEIFFHFLFLIFRLLGFLRSLRAKQESPQTQF
jgi:hypothetical protein